MTKEEKQERESEYKTRKIEELTIENAEKDKQIVELKAENEKLKDRISALEIDQSQFEELEKQLAIYKRALEIQIGNQMRTQSLLSPTAADISYIMKCRIQQAEEELEEQDNA